MEPQRHEQFHNFLRRMTPTQTVRIKDSIESYRNTHSNERPLILVDLMHLDQMVTNKETRLRNICGPNLNVLQQFERLFRFLRDECQAEIVFFVDGPSSSDTFPDMVHYQPHHKDGRYDHDIEVIDLLNNGKSCKQFLPRRLHIPTDRILMDSMKTLAQKYGILWHALQNPRYLEIAKYAVQFRAMAVLTKKMKFILLTGLLPLKVWYVLELDLELMEVSELDTASVRREMGLKTHKQRLLMTALLPGSFIGNCTTGRNLVRVHNVVKKLPGNIERDQYCAAARAIFGDRYSEALVDDLQRACKYNDVQTFELSVQKDNQSSWEYDIINNRTSVITIMLNDYRYWDEKGIHFAQLVTEFYARAAGILLTRNGQGAPQSRQLYMKRSHESHFNNYSVDVKFPDPINITHTPVPEGDITEESLDYLRFVFDIDALPTERIDRLVKSDNCWKLLDYITIFYMLKKSIISSNVADSILLAVENYNTRNALLDKVPDELNMEMFHATFMYVRWRYYVREALVICGITEALIDNQCRLDGVKVQNIHQHCLQNSEAVNEYDTNGCVRQYRFYE
ncbi:uncharacterized protein LOC131685608 [Topomyia yanbarensis]|uniref:uncharacterized protein LOC131685608 n=1 Tax=Topomyia yanbarensis TaxID=2498891 RepID=UPI00273ADF1A|nr:uncharacterized protein LOC131685608 [Topomyia yanbarensis]